MGCHFIDILFSSIFDAGVVTSSARGYLGGWLLYMTIIIGLSGAILGGFKIEYPAFNLEA